MARTPKGRLFTRGKKNYYYCQYYLNGKQIIKALRDENNKPIPQRTKNERKAEKAMNRLLAPYMAKDVEQRRQQAVEALRTAEQVAADAERDALGKLTFKEAWEEYLGSGFRPDSGDATLRQYSFQWDAFCEWAKTRSIAHLVDVTSNHAQEYSRHLQDRGLSANTINKHVRLCRLVFKTLGDRACRTGNPFDRIRTRKESQNHRKELSWNKVCEICDAAEGELKTLLFLGIYTGQRLGDLCLLTWDQVDLMRPMTLSDGQVLRGCLIVTPRKTASRSGQSLLIPIHPQLLPMLEVIPQDSRSGYLLPELASDYTASRDRVTDRIQQLLKDCGVKIYKKGTGTGTGTEKRAVIEYGFHSLRHTTVSLLQQMGVPPATIQAMVGHNTVAMLNRYTHVGEESLTSAVVSMPALAGPEEKAELQGHEPERAKLVQFVRSVPLELVREILESIEEREALDAQ